MALTLSDYLTALVFSFLATVAFAIIFQAPKRTLPISGMIGAVGWLVFITIKSHYLGSFYANLLGALALSVCCEICARVFREPATIFIAPGVIPLVPGLGIYQGMEKMLSNSDAGMRILITAGTDSIAIALGVMIMTSIFRVFKLREFGKTVLGEIKK